MQKQRVVILAPYSVLTFSVQAGNGSREKLRALTKQHVLDPHLSHSPLVDHIWGYTYVDKRGLAPSIDLPEETISVSLTLSILSTSYLLKHESIMSYSPLTMVTSSAGCNLVCITLKPTTSENSTVHSLYEIIFKITDQNL